MCVATISICKSNILSRVLETRNLDQWYLDIKNSLQWGNRKLKYPNYELVEGGIFLYRCQVYFLDVEDVKFLF